VPATLAYGVVLFSVVCLCASRTHIYPLGLSLALLMRLATLLLTFFGIAPKKVSKEKSSRHQTSPSCFFALEFMFT
jgi:hypothetical protein